MAIFTHVEHEKRTKFFAYAPYVREMNLWLSKVEEVEVVASLRTGGRGDEVTVASAGLPYKHPGLVFNKIPSFNFLSFWNTLKAVIQIPFILIRIFGAMRRADHLHLRCPGNVGLLACFAQIFFPSKPKSAKYAGNWDPQAKQPWTYKLQKRILSNTFLTRNMQVLVYGEWLGQSKNIVPFFTASFSEKVIPELKDKDFTGPINFLFVGNLVPGKQPLKAVKLVQQLRQHCKVNAINLDVYGDGPERARIEKYCKENMLEDFVQLRGNRSLEELKVAYQAAHFVILPSRSEGWPKAIAEGMFFGCIPIATPVSCVPWMLGNGSRGVLMGGKQESGDRNQDGRIEWSKGSGQWAGDLTKISRLLADPERMKNVSEEAKKWSQKYTLERFEAAIKEVLEKSNRKSSFSLGGGGGGG